AAIHLAGTGSDVSATVSLSADGRTASLAPSATLATGSYVLTVGAAVRRASDGARLGTDVVSHFTVAASGFTLLAVFPTAGSRAAARSGEIGAVFSAPLDCDSAKADADADGRPDGIDVRANGSAVCSLSEVDCHDDSLTCQPTAPLPAGARVEVAVPASLR